MARCNDLLVKGIGLNTLNKDKDVVNFVAIEDMDSCYKIKARKFFNENNTAVELNDRPVDEISCSPIGCTTSKSVKATGALEYFGAFDGNAVRRGALTFYAKGGSAGTPATMTVTVSSDKNFAAETSVSYEVTLSDADNFALNVIDFVNGTYVGTDNYTASDKGVYVKFDMASEYTISTISFYESMDDFVSTQLISLTCLTDLSQTLDYDVMEETCTASGYDTSATPTVELSITAQTASPKYRYLNPSYGLVEKGSTITGSKHVTIKRKIESGVINIADINRDECGYIGATLVNDCNSTEATLDFVSLQKEIVLEKMQFNATYDENDVATLHFNEALEGEEVYIQYPQKVDVKRMAANPKNIGTRRYKLTYSHKQSDEVEYIYHANNVFITSFPNTIGASDNTFEFTVAIQKDNNGDWFTVDQVID